MKELIVEYGKWAPSRLMECMYWAMNQVYGYGYIGRRIFGRLQWLERCCFTGPRCVVDVERFGLKWRLHGFGNVSESRLLRRPDSFEVEEMNFVLGMAVDDFVFVDVGANCGYWSLRIAKKMGEDGTVIAIEPQPVMVERLRFNAAINDSELTGIHECVVGAGAGRVRLEVDERNLGRARVSKKGSLEVEMKSLLAIIEGHGLKRIDAIKVDVEGYEDHVLGPFLRDAPASLLPGVIVAECSWKESWEADWMEGARRKGYRELKRTRNHNVILFRDM